jgi:hypothetical protein
VEAPLPTDQINLTDEDSRIMPPAFARAGSGGRRVRAVLQRPAVVAADSLLVVAADVVQAANDKQQLQPMLNKVTDCPMNWATLKRCWRTMAISVRRM